jgi:hypothetical protein
VAPDTVAEAVANVTPIQRGHRAVFSGLEGETLSALA